MPVSIGMGYGIWDLASNLIGSILSFVTIEYV
jgi:hypothetical protein